MKLPHPLAPTTPEALLGVFAALVNAALRVAIIPVFVTPVFDRVIGARDLSALPGVLGIAAVVVGVGALALFWQDALLGRAAAKIAARWREGLYASLLARAPGTLPGTSGGLTGRILTDLKEVETYTQYGLGTLVAETFTLLGIFGVLFYYNARATLILIGLGVPLVLVLALLGRRLQQVARHSQAGLEEVGAHLQEGLRHHAVIRALAATPFMLDRFHKANTATERTTVRRSALAALQTPVAQLLIFGAVALLVALLARDVAAGALSPGETVAYLVLVLLLATPAQLLPKGYALLQQARAASERLNELVEARETHTPDSSGVTLSPTLDTGLELREVSFGYAPDTPLLDTLSFTLPRHSLVALVGESGSGKTTLLQLLLRFLEPGAGAIFLGGSPLASLSEDELRRRLSYVPQSPDLVRGTVLDNLVLGRGYGEDDVWAALRAVGLEATVRALPGALGYMLREDGSGLSGGQRQRLAVARALLSEPEVLLLDEPSANLDAESESVLVTTLKRQAEKRLVLVVAHRPALVEAASLVLCLSETGRVRLESRAQQPIP